jgi:hypothetical protein
MKLTMWQTIKEIFSVIFNIIGMVFSGIWVLMKWIGKILNAITQVFAGIWTVELMADVSGMPEWAVATGLSRREYEYREEQRQRASNWEPQDDYYEEDDNNYAEDNDYHDEGRC